jgi:DNA-binding transcriptional LysR family regulator
MRFLHSLKRMEFRPLEVFVEVVRNGGFTAASERVLLTQPSISRLIRQLEEDVGATLLTRGRKGITLTDAGQIVYQRALGLLGERVRLQKELTALAGLERGELTLGIPPLGGVLFVPLVRRYKELYPSIELRLFEKGSRATEVALLESEVEIGTLILPRKSEEFDLVPYLEDRLVLAVPKTEKWAGRRPIPIEMLKGEPLILFPEEFALNERIYDACRKAGFEPLVAGRSAQAQFIEGLVESGVGLALLPYSVTRRFVTIKTRELADPGITWQIGLAWVKDAYLSHAAKALLALATSEDEAVIIEQMASAVKIDAPPIDPPPSPWLSRAATPPAKPPSV